MSALSAPTPVNAVVNSAVATAKGAKELYDNRKEVYASAKDFAGKLTSKDDKVRDYAVGQAKAYTMSAVLGGAASKALGSRLPKPNVNVLSPNFAQQKNIDRFKDKIPANSKDNINLHKLPNGGIAAQATSQGKTPGWKAVYEKQIDINGKTQQYTKTTYQPNGSIEHVKDKINGTTIYGR
ncbi:hypothetical protein F1631_01985 [Leptospira interrogans serovar Yeoncheon]|nr:hypothetical protein [Leptospira interrogans serovar Yeoncheon]